MSVQQVTFEIPRQLEAGLRAGELVRHGGVIRNTSGHIVSHLKEVPTCKPDKALQAVCQFTKAHKTALILTILVILALGMITLVLKLIRRRKIQQASERLDTALSSYFRAIINQSMNMETITEFDRALRKLRSITKKPTNELLDDIILDSLITYGQEFIDHNTSAHLNEGKASQLANLEDYLEKQKSVFA